MPAIRNVKPQEGFQMMALASSADIVIGGAAAGVGKTFSLLMEPLRHINNPKFGGVIFRRTSPQIKSEGGLWDTSMDLYPNVNAVPRESTLEWKFPKGAKLKFSHLEYEKNVLDWQGAQIPFIGFDELTHFSERMFFYLLSRNRSTCGVRPYVRATCNPDPDSWVAKFIEWWIDQETGFPIPERNGKLRYFIRYGESYIWGDTKAEVIEASWSFLQPILERSEDITVDDMVKSVAFISGDIYQNRELLRNNPEYLANLLSQDETTRLQLLEGNWKVRLSDQEIYEYYAFLAIFGDRLTEDTDADRERFISADIALEGSNKLVFGYWEGNTLEDIEIHDKTDGKEVITKLEIFARLHGVSNHKITFDGDGVGGFVGGFLQGADSFNGGMPAREVYDPISGGYLQENYKNLRTQCYYRSGQDCRDGKLRISDRVANKRYDDKMTVKQRMFYERKAIKRYKNDEDGKLRILPKQEMKLILGGNDSPDIMDMIMMRKIFDLRRKIVVALG